MLEKETRNKISVLRRMIEGEEMEPQLIVPQNSLTQMAVTERKMNLCDMNALKNSAPAIAKCPHCENMAKNFLYLESLIRSNYDPQHECHLCYSAIKYLNFVNKSILHVFGQFNSIVEAAQTFASNSQRSKLAKRKGTRGKLRLPRASTGTKGKLSSRRQTGGSNLSPEVSYQNAAAQSSAKNPKPAAAATAVKKKVIKKGKKPAAKKPKSGSKLNVCADDVKKRTKTATMIGRALHEKTNKIKRKKVTKANVPAVL